MFPMFALTRTRAHAQGQHLHYLCGFDWLANPCGGRWHGCGAVGQGFNDLAGAVREFGALVNCHRNPP